jgi:hypothetical protein
MGEKRETRRARSKGALPLLLPHTTHVHPQQLTRVHTPGYTVRNPPQANQKPVPPRQTSRLSSTMDGPPAVEEPSTPSSSTASVHSTASKVWGVCLVAFDHAVGPTIEYSYPPELSLNEELNKNLPFLALPDGAHTVSLAL